MILGKVSEIEVEYDEDMDALFLMKGDDTYGVEVIGIWDESEAKELIAFLIKFIEMKENKKMKLSESLTKHLLYLGVESVKVENNKVVGYEIKKGSISCSLTNRDVEMIIRTWKCCEGSIN